MKQLTCEMCGSTDLMKQDGVFICQTCGCKYSIEEAKKMFTEIEGKVEIDHTTEIENLLIRAQQFMDQNDLNNALKYCNRVLDLASDEVNAVRIIDAISNEKNRQEKQKANTVKIIKNVIDPNVAFENFLRSIRYAPDITPDIYKEIEVISVTNGYYPFEIIDKQFNCTYEGVACYRKQIPYTDYETKTDYNNKNQDGTYKTKQVAVTKYREEIERQPVKGLFLAENFRAFSVGEKLNNLITSISPEQYDSVIKKDAYFDETMKTDIQRTKYNDAIMQKIEMYITESYNSINNFIENIDLSEKDEIDGIKIVPYACETWQNRANDTFAKEVQEIVGKKAYEVIPGDFNENTHYRWTEKYSKIERIYIPIQIIEYAYRGKFYISVMFLNQDENLTMSYPCNTEIQSEKKKADETVANIKKRSIPAGIIILYTVAASGILLPIIFTIEGDTNTIAFLIALIILLVFGIPATIWNVLWKKKKNKELKQQLMESSEAVDSIEKQYDLELSKEYRTFFDVFNNADTMSAAVSAVKKESSFVADISTIKGRIAFVSLKLNNNSKYNDKKNNKDNKTLFDENGLEISAEYTYSIYLLSCGSNKIEVLKILREEYGLGLAAAKEMAETPHSLIEQGMNSSKTKSLALKLKSIGATVEIKREL